MRRTVRRCLLYARRNWRAMCFSDPPKADLLEWYPWRRPKRRVIIDNWLFLGNNWYGKRYYAPRFFGHPTTTMAKVKVDRPIIIIVVSLRYNCVHLQIIVFVLSDRDGDRTTRFITIWRYTGVLVCPRDARSFFVFRFRFYFLTSSLKTVVAY